MTGEVLDAARTLAARYTGDKVLVLAGAEWPGGVIGLVAGRLAEETGRPVFLIEASSAICRGSARGQGRLDVYAALEQCRDLLIAKSRGHATGCRIQYSTAT